jgi:hypothetical protein
MKGNDEAAHPNRDESEDDEEGADEAHLFADHGKDEVGLGERHVEHLQTPFTDPAPGHAAGAKGHEGDPLLEAGAEAVLFGIEEGHDALHPVRGVAEHPEEADHGGEDQTREVFPIHSGDKENEEGGAGKHGGGADVDLEEDERKGHSDDGQRQEKPA